MRSSIFLLLFMGLSMLCKSQFVFRVQLKEPIAGLCNDANVYTLMPAFDSTQKEAIPPVSKDSMLSIFSTKVIYLKEHSKIKDKGMVSIFINCKGDVVKCEMDKRTKNATLDSQILSVFKSLDNWTPGRLNNKSVDSMMLWRFEIKKGVINFGE